MELKYQMHTFGCKVNTYDSGLMQKGLSGEGFSAQDSVSAQPRIHVLNTCAVTQEATKEALRLIRKLKSKDPFCTVVVTGCAAQVDTEEFSKLPGADLVIANSHKSQIPEIIKKYFQGQIKEKVFRSNIFRHESLGEGGGTEAKHSRSFLKIQDGCNSFCSFCIIPYARGKSRSLSISSIVRRVQELAQQGFHEVVLTGIHIGDYQDETSRGKGDLADLVANLLQKTNDLRFRLGSLEPVELTDELMELFSNDRLCPHFHMSIQAASTDVLFQMKRQYGRTEVENALFKIHNQVPGAFVGMDVIAGFPTETEEQFLETYQVLAETPWTRLHVFPYSERSGTKAAALMQQIPMEVRKARAERLRHLSDDRVLIKARQQIGTTKQIVLLNRPSGQPQGLSQDYWHVQLQSPVDEALAVRSPNDRPGVFSVNITDVSEVRHGDVLLAGQFNIPRPEFLHNQETLTL